MSEDEEISLTKFRELPPSEISRGFSDLKVDSLLDEDKLLNLAPLPQMKRWQSTQAFGTFRTNMFPSHLECVTLAIYQVPEKLLV